MCTHRASRLTQEHHIYNPPPYQPAPRRGVAGGLAAALAIGGTLFGMLTGCVAGFAMGESQPQPKAVAATARAASSSSARPKSKTSPVVSASARTTAVPKPKPAAVTIGEGTWRVPQDVKPGTYRTKGADGGNCYWARLRDLTGEFNAIITNGNSDGPSVITIRSSDKGFLTHGCHDWTRI